MPVNADDRALVLADIRALASAEGHPLERVEHTLTDGYACVLQVEAERLRLRRALEERAVGTNGRSRRAELAELARGIARADEELAELRAALGRLTEVAQRLRAG